MKYWDKYPSNYRLLIGLISATLLSVIIYNFVDIASSVTDENLYSDPQSRFYIKDQIKGKIIERDNGLISTTDSLIPKGSILAGINDLKYDDEIDLKKFLNLFRPQDTLELLYQTLISKTAPG